MSNYALRKEYKSFARERKRMEERGQQRKRKKEKAGAKNGYDLKTDNPLWILECIDVWSLINDCSTKV